MITNFFFNKDWHVVWHGEQGYQEVLWRGVKEIKRVVLELREYT
jgi:hypothetical protein